MKKGMKKLFLVLAFGLVMLVAAGCNKTKKPVEVSSYTVTFDYNDGVTASRSVVVDKDSTVEKPADPESIETRRFVGWFKDRAGKVKFSFDTPIVEDTTLYAYYSEGSTVTLVYNYKNDDGSNKTEKKEKVFELTAESVGTPERPGYTFDGWYKDSDLKNKIEFPVQVYGRMSIYAKWRATGYTISFVTNSDQTINSKISDYGQKIGNVVPDKSKKLGAKEFDGWYLDPAFSSKVDLTEYIITDNAVLYAKWIMKDVLIQFVDNSSGENIEIYRTTSYHYGDMIDIGKLQGSSMNVTKEGYNFEGWYLNSILTNPIDTPNTFIVTAEDSTSDTLTLILYAKYVDNESSLVLHANANGNNGASFADNKDSRIFEPNGNDSILNQLNAYNQDPNNIPKKIGYVFVEYQMYNSQGELVSITDKSLSINFSITVNLNQTYNLYAKWEKANYSIDVYFNVDNEENYELTHMTINREDITIDSEIDISDYLAYAEDGDEEKGISVTRATSGKEFKDVCIYFPNSGEMDCNSNLLGATTSRIKISTFADKSAVDSNDVRTLSIIIYYTSLNFEVVFDANGGVFSSNNRNEYVVGNVPYGTELVNYQDLTAVNYGYSFDGWDIYEIKDDEEVEFISDKDWTEYFVREYNLKLVARWELVNYSIYAGDVKINVDNLHIGDKVEFGYVSDSLQNVLDNNENTKNRNLSEVIETNIINTYCNNVNSNYVLFLGRSISRSDAIYNIILVGKANMEVVTSNFDENENYYIKNGDQYVLAVDLKSFDEEQTYYIQSTRNIQFANINNQEIVQEKEFVGFYYEPELLSYLTFMEITTNVAKNLDAEDSAKIVIYPKFDGTSGFYYLYNDETYEYTVREYLGSDIDVEIPNYFMGKEITRIDSNCFNTEEGYRIRSLSIPKSINKYDKNCLSYMLGLKSLTLPLNNSTFNFNNVFGYNTSYIIGNLEYLALIDTNVVTFALYENPTPTSSGLIGLEHLRNLETLVLESSITNFNGEARTILQDLHFLKNVSFIKGGFYSTTTIVTQNSIAYTKIENYVVGVSYAKVINDSGEVYVLITSDNEDQYKDSGEFYTKTSTILITFINNNNNENNFTLTINANNLDTETIEIESKSESKIDFYISTDDDATPVHSVTNTISSPIETSYNNLFATWCEEEMLENKTFVGWYYDKDFTNPYIYENMKMAYGDDVVLYAKFIDGVLEFEEYEIEENQISTTFMRLISIKGTGDIEVEVPEYYFGYEVRQICLSNTEGTDHIKGIVIRSNIDSIEVNDDFAKFADIEEFKLSQKFQFADVISKLRPATSTKAIKLYILNDECEADENTFSGLNYEINELHFYSSKIYDIAEYPDMFINLKVKKFVNAANGQESEALYARIYDNDQKTHTDYALLRWNCDDNQDEVTISASIDDRSSENPSGDNVHNIKYVGPYAFYNLNHIANIKFDEGSSYVTAIMDFAFANIDNLEEFKVGKRINSIASNAFDGSNKLHTITASIENGYYRSVDGILYSFDSSVLVKYPTAKGKSDGVNEFTIPVQTIAVADNAMNFENKHKITILNTLRYIGASVVFDTNLYDVRVKNATFEGVRISIDNRNLYIGSDGYIYRYEGNAFAKYSIIPENSNVNYAIYIGIDGRLYDSDNNAIQSGVEYVVLDNFKINLNNFANTIGFVKEEDGGYDVSYGSLYYKKDTTTMLIKYGTINETDTALIDSNISTSTYYIFENKYNDLFVTEGKGYEIKSVIINATAENSTDIPAICADILAELSSDIMCSYVQKGEYKIYTPGNLIIDGNSLKSQSGYFTYGTNVLYEAPITEGVGEFMGWYKDENYENPVLFPYVFIDENSPIYAKFGIRYTVSFESKGGTNVNAMSVLNEIYYKDIPEPTKAEYNFAGWYFDTACTRPVFEHGYQWYMNPENYAEFLNAKYVVSMSGLVFYAKWIALNYQEVSLYESKFNSNSNQYEAIYMGYTFIPDAPANGNILNNFKNSESKNWYSGINDTIAVIDDEGVVKVPNKLKASYTAVGIGAEFVKCKYYTIDDSGNYVNVVLDKEPEDWGTLNRYYVKDSLNLYLK